MVDSAGRTDVKGKNGGGVPTRDGGTERSTPQRRPIFKRVAGVGGACCIGNAGLDLLTQHGEVVIDFSEMTLSIR